MKVIYEILYGSDAYGTTTNDSDNDIRGILLPTIDESLSMNGLNDVQVKNDQEDRVMFPLQKFVRLAIRSNPAVFEWLFVPNTCIRIMEEPAKMLRNNRLLFLSKEIYPRFRGFAYSEFSSLTKMTGETGAKRKDQIMTFGYSPKNAMNCIRLIRQGVELLNTAYLTMPRPDAKELVEIKLGKLRYEEIVRMFDNELKNLDKALENSKLPESPRYNDADNLMIRILKEFNY
jgi:predicted nucleotidyltransferase